MVRREEHPLHSGAWSLCFSLCTAWAGLACSPTDCAIGSLWLLLAPTASDEALGRLASRPTLPLHYAAHCCLLADCIRIVSLWASSSCPLACLLACLLAHCGSFICLLEDLPMLMADSLPRGWKWLIRALWERSLCARHADCNDCNGHRSRFWAISRLQAASHLFRFALRFETIWHADGLNAQPDGLERFKWAEPTASGQPALPLRSAFPTVCIGMGGRRRKKDPRRSPLFLCYLMSACFKSPSYFGVTMVRGNT